eukprot:Amastigsp_a3627_17.p1 type:complete len:335 gc:universal Amastigsp_a3627_17:1050-46(-)
MASAAMDASGPGAQSASDAPKSNFVLKHTLVGHTRSVSATKFANNGLFIASVSADKSLRIWNAETGGLERVIEGHSMGISDVAWSTDSKYLVTASDDRTLRLWEASSGELLKTFAGHRDRVMACEFNAASSLIASGSFDESVQLWDVRTGRSMAALPAHSDPVVSVSFSRDGTLLLSGSFDGLCRIWDVASGQCVKTLMHDDNPSVGHARFSPNGKYVLAYYLDQHVGLWDYKKSRELKSYSAAGPSAPKTPARYCCPATFTLAAPPKVVGTTETGAIIVWDLNSRLVSQRIDAAHAGPIVGLGAHPSKSVIVTGSIEPEPCVRVWAEPTSTAV